MGNLVFIHDGKAVTDSLTVAEVFGKEHRRVLQDIRELGCSEEFRRHNFVQSSYVNSQNKEMPMYYMNRKGFTLLVMGYTGPKAMEFKEKYIEQFEKMEEMLQNQPRILSDREKLIASMKLSLETAEEVQIIKNDVKQLKEVVNEQLTINSAEQTALWNAKQKRVEQLWASGEINYEIFDTKKKLHARAWTDLKLAFGVPSYRDVKKKDFQEALAFIKAWRPRMI
jgi:Rha family phage regulatory protein